MKDGYLSQIQTPIAVSSGALVWLEIKWCEQTIFSINFTTIQNPAATDIFPQRWCETFERYWENPRDRTTQIALEKLPIVLNGTVYQKKVWSLLQNIDSGTTASYGAISDQFDSSPRAVAAACRANPVVLVVPCHRVVSKSGIGGFMGATEGESIDIKQWLLNHEQ